MLPRIVGHATALDLLLSSRVVLGDEAAAIGLVHRAVPAGELLPSALAYAHELADNCSPRAMWAAKRQVYLDWERSLDESRRDARRIVAALKEQSKDFREGVSSFVDRRASGVRALVPADRCPRRRVGGGSTVTDRYDSFPGLTLDRPVDGVLRITMDAPGLNAVEPGGPPRAGGHLVDDRSRSRHAGGSAAGSGQGVLRRWQLRIVGHAHVGLRDPHTCHA